MATLRVCVGMRSNEVVLQALEEAVKDNAHVRLAALLQDGLITADDLDRRDLLHWASWLGHPKCVSLLIQYGANPDKFHRKNGCTPLHLAHLCKIDDTNPAPTVDALIAAGASVNSAGSPTKCGRFPIDHAIQYQRLDAVEVLLAAGAMVTLQTVLIAIDVTKAEILERLLLAGGKCGKPMDSILYWGEPLHRVLYTPLKCPRNSYKQMFQLLVESTLCKPSSLLPVVTVEESSSQNSDEVNADQRVTKTSNHHLVIEAELRTLAKDYTDLSLFLFSSLVANGFHPTDSIKFFVATLGNTDWLDEYLTNAPPLRDLCVRLIRSRLYLTGNILYGITRLSIPRKLKDVILQCG